MSTIRLPPITLPAQKPNGVAVGVRLPRLTAAEAAKLAAIKPAR